MTLSPVDFELLLQANRILSSKLSVDEVLQAVLELATKVVRAEASSLLLLDERTNELYFDVALGSVGDQVKQVRIKVGEGIAGWVAKEIQPLIVNDVSQDKRFTQKVDKATSFRTRSILAVPLQAKGRLVGVVEAINKENEQDFSQQDLEAFSVFASQAGIALENARLFSAVTNEKKKLDTVFSEMTDGVLVLNDEGKVTIINEAGSRFLGLSREEALGRTFDPALFPEFESNPSIHDIRSFKTELTSVDLSRHEGKDFYLKAMLHRLQGDGKGASGWMVILHDVSEEKRGEILKRDFLSLISHKLKTPLTVILGYAPILQTKMEGLNEIQKKAVQAICSQSEHLSELVEKLLRFTIVESGHLEKPKDPISLKRIVEEAVVGLKSLIDDENVRVDIAALDDSLPKVWVDHSLLMEVIKNLMENAIKFNDKKEKTIRLHAEKKNGGISLQIQDNGRGIPPEEKDKVFEKFYQVENSFTGQVPGAGLGLAFCRKVVEESGGRIDIQSHLGQGTTLDVYFPVTP